jgi:hypothetical protein
MDDQLVAAVEDQNLQLQQPTLTVEAQPELVRGHVVVR